MNIPQNEFDKIGAITKREAYQQAPRNPFKLWFGAWMRTAGVSEPVLDDVFEAIIARHRKSHLWSVPEPGVPQILRDLRDVGLTLGIISNSDGSVNELLEKFQLDYYFKCILDSALEGIEKPDARIFLRAIDILQCSPADCLCVGDHPVYDVQGAQNAGLQAALLDPQWLETSTDCVRIRRFSELKTLLNL